MTISLSVEGMVCEEQEGHVNIYNALYYILQGSGVLPPWFLIQWGLENSRGLLHTLTSTHIPIIAFLSSSLRLKKRGKVSGENERKNSG
jgi:hypothetical protein